MAVTAVTLYIVLEYFKMKKKEHLIKFSKKDKSLPAEVVHRLVVAEVWSHSRSKLQLIKSILVINSIEERKVEVEMKIRNILERQSSIYLDYFNDLNAPIDSLGDWYSNNFEMERFFQELLTVIFRKDRLPITAEKDTKEQFRELFINQKIEDIANIMLKYQSDTGRKLNEELKRKEDSILNEKTKIFFLF